MKNSSLTSSNKSILEIDKLDPFVRVKLKLNKELARYLALM